MKIILAGPYPTGTFEKFAELLPHHEIVTSQLQKDFDLVDEGDVIIVRVLKTFKETLRNKHTFRAIVRWGTGFDTVDIETAGRMGIRVATTPGANAYAVSELTIALMLNVGRKIVNHNELTHSGIWNNKIYSDEMTSLNGKIVGLIGGGNIGRSVANQAQAFGAEVVYYDQYRLNLETEQQNKMTYVSFEELLKVSDVISLHIPLSEETQHIISRDELNLMKDNVIIINTARGGLIDDNALHDALKSGKVLGAGLDCVENENMKESPLAEMANVVITPHIGGTTNDLPSEMIPRIVEQIKRLECGDEMIYVVNKEFIND